jgi:hypothetical protein
MENLEVEGKKPRGMKNVLYNSRAYTQCTEGEERKKE